MTDERLPCEKCDDSGYIEYVSGGLGGGRATWRHEICDCICGDDVRRELRARPPGRLRMDLTTAMNIAGSVSTGSPQYQAACGLCQLRMIDPFSYSFALQGFQNWQVVVVEQLLGDVIIQFVKASA